MSKKHFAVISSITIIKVNVNTFGSTGHKIDLEY